MAPAGIIKLFLLVCCFLRNSRGKNITLFDDLVRRVQALKYPWQRNCDVLILDSGAARFADDSTSIVLGSDNTNKEFIGSNLYKETGCIIMISKTQTNISMLNYIYLTEKVSNSMFIFWGEKLPRYSLVYTAKSVLHVQPDKLFKQAEISVLCKPRNQESLTTINGETEDILALAYIPVDFWMQNRGFLFPKTDLFQPCEHPLGRRTLNISYNGLQPYIIGTPNHPFDPKGAEVDIIKLLAKKLAFKPIFQLKGWSSIDPVTRRQKPGGVVYDVRTGSSAIGIGYKVFVLETSRDVDYTTYLYSDNVVWASRNPKKLKSYTNLTKAFSPVVWTAMYVTLLLLSISFAIIFAVYKRIPGDLLETKSVIWLDFVLLPFCRFVSPDPLPWFEKWSTGKMMVLFWTCFTLFMVFFYTCNLRACLIAKRYEKPFDTSQDVADRAKHVYIQTAQTQLNHLLMPYMPDILRRISIIAHNTEGGFYDMTKYNLQLPPYARKDVLENGAVYLSPELLVLYEYILNKSYGLPNIHVSKEYPIVYHGGFVIPKYVPWKRSIDHILSQLRDMGFIKRFIYQRIPLEATMKWSPQDDQDDLEMLTLQHILMGICLIIVGWFLGMVAFAAELIAAVVKKRGFGQSQLFKKEIT